MKKIRFAIAAMVLAAGTFVIFAFAKAEKNVTEEVQTNVYHYVSKTGDQIYFCFRRTVSRNLQYWQYPLPFYIYSNFNIPTESESNYCQCNGHRMETLNIEKNENRTIEK